MNEINDDPKTFAETSAKQEDSEKTKDPTEISEDTEISTPKRAKMNDIPTYFTECCPIKSLEDLYTVTAIPPGWVQLILPRQRRSSSVIRNVVTDCHHVDGDSFLPRERIDWKFVPKTLVCHDYKGGYRQDKFLSEINVGNAYTFYNWAHIDIFVYFSHHFITIPPLCWINAAHKNGVKILGTLITEGQTGTKICESIFQSTESMHRFANHLVKVTKIFKFDGWLLNIENIISEQCLPNLKLFVSYLTEEIHEDNPENVVIWYDSVTFDGKLSWQNELNELNRCFFDACDGIFLNYCWDEKKIISSITLAKHRSLDVFAGIDIFGRNTFGGGGFTSFVAAEVIRRHNASMAIFAPGWTHETIIHNHMSRMEHFLNRDSALWCSLWPYLYTHPIRDFFKTTFFKGADYNHFDLFKQEQELSKICYPKHHHLVPTISKIPTLNNRCSCLQIEHLNDKNYCLITKHNLSQNTKYVHNLFSCDMDVSGNVVVYYLTKPGQHYSRLGAQILTVNYSNSFRKYILHGNSALDILKHNKSTVEVNPTQNLSIINAIRKSLKSEDEILIVTAFLLYNIPPCKILEIGGVLEEGESILLAGFGIKRFVNDFLIDF